MNLGIRQLHTEYRSGSLKPADVVREVYREIRVRGERPVWIHLLPEAESVARAEALGEFNESLPLYGVPFAVKDNIDIAGVETTAACPAFRYVPEQTATVVSLLIGKGAIPIGKTNMDQFATGLVGVRTPYGSCSSVFRHEYISGGSSSGSAVAVASGLVSFSLGTDTAGSGRVPAAFNNTVGLKPTRGALSTTGVVPACRSLDCVSIFSMSVADAQIVWEAASSFDPEDSYARRSGQPKAWPARLRFGVPPREMLEFFGDNESERLFDCAGAKLEAAGHTKVEIDYAVFREVANLLYSGPWVAERLASIREFLAEHRADLHPVTSRIILGAEGMTAADAFLATYRLSDLARRAEREWTRMDLLLLPTAGTIYTHAQVDADPIGTNSNLGYYTNFVNLLDLAAIAIPAGFRENGTPFGVSLIGPAWSDLALLDFAAKFLGESSLPSPYCPAGYVPLAVCGAHLSGQPLNWQLTEAGAFLLEATTTSPEYRLYALKGTVPPKPGLVKSASGGAEIEVEVWAVPEATFGPFVANVPPPLAIGSCTLAGGRTVKSFVSEPLAVEGAEEITRLGGWRAFVQRRSSSL